MTYSCADAATNTVTVSRTVIVQEAVDTTPPTFDSSELNSLTEVLTITFLEEIDVTPATKVDPAKIHVRESGNYTGGITLSVGELGTTSDDATISFTLTQSQLTTVAGLTTPELTIEPGAVQDASGNLIDGTFDASTLSFVDNTFIRGQENSPGGIAFSNNGTKMFIVGSTGKDVNEYDLLTPFDASTRSFVDNTFIRKQETSPQDIAFSNDGTKMFIVGTTGKDVNEYDLSTPFDASSRSFVDATDIDEQDTFPVGIAFSNNGTKMFILGAIGDDVNEYDLLTPFDASTLSFVDATDIGEQEDSPRGIAFSNDGTKMFIVGTIGDDVNEYDLLTPFDASTLSFVNATDIGEQEDSPQDIAFSNDGTKMFIVGTTGDDVNEYDLHSVYPITVTGTPTLPAGAFVTTWSVTASPYIIRIPVEVHTDGTLTIDWGDGNTTAVRINDIPSHTYLAPGEYQVSMTGDLSRIILGPLDTSSKLASIDQWGDIEWSSMEEMFYEASNMVYHATDTPDLSDVSSMNGMFSYASSFNGNISSWNVSSVTNMSNMFIQATSFNQPLNGWNVSSVRYMSSMFIQATSFNQSLNNWNVSGVTSMFNMFAQASSFNQTLNDWDVLKVTDMSYMFSGAEVFNQPLNNWNVSKVTNTDSMFEYASSFNGDISTWNVSAVTNMNSMFDGASSFNQPLNNWNVSAVTDMTFMFSDASSFNQTLNDWDVLKVTDMSYMFSGAEVFNQPLNNWNVSKVTNTDSMFEYASSFNQPLNDWDVSKVTDMFYMFFSASSFNGDISTWNVSAVTNMNSMFDGASSFNQTLNGWDVSAVLRMDDMFDGADAFDQNLGKWYVVPADTAYDTSEGTLNVTTISAQNAFLDDDHTLSYGIGIGGNSTLFDITDSNTLMFKSTPSADTYNVNVTASGTNVFEDGNNWRTLDITVSGSGNAAPTVNAGTDQQEAEGSTVNLDATVTDTDTEDALTYAWTHNSTLSITLANDSVPDTTFTAPNVSEETDIEFTLTVSDGTATVSDKTIVTVTDSPNDPPVVNAGDDQDAVVEGSTVNLDATVTDDDTGDALTYAWTHNSTLSITLANDSVPDTTFTAPNVSEETDIEFTLTVSDGTATVSDKTIVTVTDSPNDPPVVNAGDDQDAVVEGSTVNLDATVTDTDTEDALTYAWTHNSTLSITLANDSVPDTTFTAPNVSEETDIEFTLTVSDGTATVSDKTIVTVTDSPNDPPVVNAGDDQDAVVEGSTVNLDATVTDTDTEDALTYAWTHNSTLSITLANDSVPDTTFTAPNVSEETDIEFTLTVSDGTATVSDKTIVTVTDSPNDPPVVNAGDDQDAVVEGSTVNLDATVTDTDTEDALTYAWTHNSTLSITLANDSVPDTTFTAPNVSEETDIEFTLTVSDGTATVSDKTIVTVTDSPNDPPVVNAGDDQDAVVEGSTVNLDATVTDTDTEDALTYAWTHNSTLSITLANDSVPDTTFTAPNVSEETDIEFTLTVSDGTATVSDKTIVTVTDSPNDPPVVNAGDDQDAVVEGSTVNLDATVTDTDTEDALTYAWTHNSTLSITLANDSVPDTTFTAPNVSEETDIEFTLTVSDGTATVSDKTIVTVTDSPNDPPVVNAGDDQDAVVEGSTVNLDATVTDTDTEDALTYAWTHNSTLSITLANDSVPHHVYGSGDGHR